jgi:hypothetical protein
MKRKNDLERVIMVKIDAKPSIFHKLRDEKKSDDK